MSVSLLNTTLNKIHQWNTAEHHPLKRMFLTRVSEIGCAAIEASAIVFKTSQLMLTCLKQPSVQNLKSRVNEISRLMIGLVSTIFIGMFFSPEGNFKIHLKLHLAVDSLAEKNQKILAAKLEAEMVKNEINASRDARFSKLQEEPQGDKNSQTQFSPVYSRLTELLNP